MKNFLAVFMAAFLAMGIDIHVAPAATIDLGGIKLRLPRVEKDRPRRTKRYRSGESYSASTASHARWHIEIQEGFQFATNNQGVWIGYNEQGFLVMQIETPFAVQSGPDKKVPVNVEINQRLYRTVAGTVANEDLVVIHDAEVERILERLMRGRRLGIQVGENRIETHLKGSSNAIRDIRKGAANQRRLFAQGKVRKKQAQAEPGPDNVRFFQPGVSGMGTATVTFNIVKGSGLVLYVGFSQIEGHDEPAYKIMMNAMETKRAIKLIRKSKGWTDIARKNRVGLFSKRIGYIDDVNGEPLEGATDPDGQDAIVGDPSAEGVAAIPETETAAKPETAPANFLAANFNSYEDGSTSTQIEHSVEGYSRRFNLPLTDALQLAANLETTLEQASYRLEKRKFDQEATDKLFQ